MNLEPHSVRKDVWYNHLCKATPLPTKTDPYDGKVKPYNINDLGRTCFEDHRFEYCSQINDGDCQKFKKRRWLRGD